MLLTQFVSRSIEHDIGETVADAVCAISRALTEYQEGGLRAETKVRFGELSAFTGCGNTPLDIYHSRMRPDIMARLYFANGLGRM
jgi:hypothetical protein